MVLKLIEKNRMEVIFSLLKISWSIDSIPSDLTIVIHVGRVSREIVYHLADLEKSPIF